MKLTLKAFSIFLIMITAFDSNARRRSIIRNQESRHFSHTAEGFKKHFKRHLASQNNQSTQNEKMENSQASQTDSEQPNS